jgi:hypothetical protein
MPKVFVHGNPEASALWRVLFAELEVSGVDDLAAFAALSRWRAKWPGASERASRC